MALKRSRQRHTTDAAADDADAKPTLHAAFPWSGRWRLGGLLARSLPDLPNGTPRHGRANVPAAVVRHGGRSPAPSDSGCGSDSRAAAHAVKVGRLATGSAAVSARSPGRATAKPRAARGCRDAPAQ